MMGGAPSPLEAYGRIAAADAAEVVVFLRTGLAIGAKALRAMTELAVARPCVVVRDEDLARRWEDVLGYGRPAAVAVPRAAFLAADRPQHDFGIAAELELLLRIGDEPVVVPGLWRFAQTTRRHELDRARDAGSAALELVALHRSALERLPVGGFAEAAPVERVLRRVLLRARVTPRMLPSARSATERYAYWHGVAKAADRDTWRRLTRCTTILMYHAFAARGERASRLVVPARRFRRQLWSLRALRRPVLTFGEYAALRRAGELPPPRAVVITIDDGYLDNGTVAFPALRAAGVPATLFVVTGSVGGTNAWDRGGELAARPLLDADGLRELASGGIEIGNHTRTHPHLPELPVARVEDELTGAQDDLRRLGLAGARLLAYPHGLSSSAVEAAAERTGFVAACGVGAGLNCSRTPMFALRRTIVDGRHGLMRFAIRLLCGDPAPIRAQLAGVLPSRRAQGLPERPR